MSSVRHEYLDGEIYAMAGGNPGRAALAAAVIRLLGPLSAGCRTFTSDLRVRVVSTGFSTYPDVAVIRGATQRAADDQIEVVNPVLLVEITSDSTEKYDRGERLRHYKGIPSLREILIVSHREPHLTVHSREAEAWVTFEAGRHDVYRDLEDLT